jgi:hypothetical protein
VGFEIYELEVMARRIETLFGILNTLPLRQRRKKLPRALRFARRGLLLPSGEGAFY